MAADRFEVLVPKGQGQSGHEVQVWGVVAAGACGHALPDSAGSRDFVSRIDRRPCGDSYAACLTCGATRLVLEEECSDRDGNTVTRVVLAPYDGWLDERWRLALADSRKAAEFDEVKRGLVDLLLVPQSQPGEL